MPCCGAGAVSQHALLMSTNDMLTVWSRNWPVTLPVHLLLPNHVFCVVYRWLQGSNRCSTRLPTARPKSACIPTCKEDPKVWGDLILALGITTCVDMHLWSLWARRCSTRCCVIPSQGKTTSTSNSGTKWYHQNLLCIYHSVDLRILLFFTPSGNPALTLGAVQTHNQTTSRAEGAFVDLRQCDVQLISRNFHLRTFASNPYPHVQRRKGKHSPEVQISHSMNPTGCQWGAHRPGYMNRVLEWLAQRLW